MFVLQYSTAPAWSKISTRGLFVVCFVLYNAALMKIVSNGGGTHVASGELNLKAAIDWTVVNEVFYLMTQIFLKVSLGYFFLRVIVKKNQRYFILATVALSTVNNIAHFFFVIFRCGDPRHLAENQLARRCASSEVTVAMGYQQASVTTVTDLVFVFMHIPMLWNVQMDLRSKISAGLILSMGAFGSVCSIIRFLYIRNLAFGEDFFWSAVNISIWSTIELGMGIVAGSLATMRPLLKRVVRGRQTHLSPTTRSKLLEKNTGTGTWQSATRTAPTFKGPNSLASLSHPWQPRNQSNGLTTTCVGGVAKSSKGFKWGSRSASRNASLNRSKNMSRMTSTIDTTHTMDKDRAAIWPFDEEMGIIARVVDVEISISDAPQEESTQSRSSRLSEEVRGLWRGRRDETKSWTLEQPRPIFTRASSVPDWDRMPSLHIVRPSSATPPRTSSSSKSSSSPS